MSQQLRLSVSKTKTFLDCRAKFKFSYIEKLPKKDWEHHTLGKFCHKVLEDFHVAYIEGSTEPYNVIMQKAFKAAVVEYKAAMTPEMKKECWVMIDKYLKIVSDDKKNNTGANVIACEKNFELLVDDKVLLNGMIDRIQIDGDGVLHVADYKTTKDKKYLKDDWFQLLTYCFIMINEDPSITKVRASYILLRHNFEYITKEFSVPEIMTVQDKYLQYADQILSEKEYKPTTSGLCRFCDYLNLCPEGKTKMSWGQQVYGEVSY
jgi:CRISPR/Cas system-associated exonuclease Cas4 (RecB family)